jgi:hypothetical protein
MRKLANQYKTEAKTIQVSNQIQISPFKIVRRKEVKDLIRTQIIWKMPKN